MKPVNKAATKVLDTLTAGLPVHEYRKRTSDGFMPLTVERIDENFYAVSHVGEMNGDLMRDPEVVFWKKDGRYYPVQFQNDYVGIFQRLVTFDGDERPVSYAVRAQTDCATFCATWMRNIRAQGF